MHKFGPGTVNALRVVPDEAALIRTLVEQIVDHNGNVHSATCFLNDNGYTNHLGNRWRYAAVSNLLHCPRLAGLVRLRTDRTRLHDPDYLGELFPEELIYDESEGPEPGFKPPIEPIIPYPLWEKLQRALALRGGKHGPHARYFASGLVTCGTCGAPLVGGRVSNGIQQYHCSKPHLRGISRSAHSSRLKTSADGKRHPTMRVEQLDQALAEVLFAAIDRDPDPAFSDVNDFFEASKETHRRAIAALSERLGNISYMLARGTITRVSYDEFVAEINDELGEHRLHLDELKEQRPHKTLPDRVTLRELWPELNVNERREWFGVVFESVVLNPAANIGAQNIATRIDLTFREGYEPPEEEITALLYSIEYEIRRNTEHGRLPAAIADKILALSQQGHTFAEIGRMLKAEGIVGPRGGRKWTAGRVCYALKIACKERHIPYPSPVLRSGTPPETQRLIVALAKKMGSYAAVARELTKLSVPRPNGDEWTSHAVRDVLVTHERQTGNLRPRPRADARRRSVQRYLPLAIREQLWDMHRREGLTLREIAEWLERSGIKTAHGKPTWAHATILDVIRGIDDDRRRAASEPEAA